jgi:hypothetical protein
MNADLAKLCNRCSLVFPAWEAFEKRLDNPNTYFMIYKPFLRTGDKEYKFCSGQKTVSAQCSTVKIDSRMVTPLDEAFALAVLKNNYFAWLLQAMKEFPNLLTDYNDDKLNEQSVTMAEYILGDYLLDLEKGEEGRGFAWNGNMDSERDKYDNTKETYNVVVGNLRNEVKEASEEYQQILHSIAFVYVQPT